MRTDELPMRRLLRLLMILALLCCAAAALAEDRPAYDGSLRIENGTLLPMCEYSDPRNPAYSNE